jgi:hypothetical protein
MAQNVAIFQSGQTVPFTGKYEVVAATVSNAANKYERPVRYFEAGQQFPSYEGRSVAWHFNTEEPEKLTATAEVASR